MQSHPQSPSDNIETVIAGDPHGHDAPQCNGEPQSGPVVWETACDSNDSPVERPRKPCAVRFHGPPRLRRIRARAACAGLWQGQAVSSAPVFRGNADFGYGADVLIAHVKIAARCCAWIKDMKYVVETP
jgi:hypothetical protein